MRDFVRCWTPSPSAAFSPSCSALMLPTWHWETPTEAQGAREGGNKRGRKERKSARLWPWQIQLHNFLSLCYEYAACQLGSRLIRTFQMSLSAARLSCSSWGILLSQARWDRKPPVSSGSSLGSRPWWTSCHSSTETASWSKIYVSTKLKSSSFYVKHST